MMDQWIEDDIQLKGSVIHFSRTGTGSKPPVVFVHGFSDSGKCWLRVAQALEADYDLILPDMRGHGLSARIKPGQEINMVEDVAGLILGLQLDRPVVGGHSMGANVSAGLGARYPGLMRGLILEDPGWRNPEPPKSEALVKNPPPQNPFEDWLVSLKDTPMEEVIAYGRAMNPAWDEMEMPAWAESKKQFDPAFLKARQGPRRDWREAVRDFACPTLLIAADTGRGAIVSPEIAKEAESLNKKIQVVTIDGAGHNIRRENFPDYMQVVKEFLAGCWR